MTHIDMDAEEPDPEERIHTTTISVAFSEMENLMGGKILNVLSLPSMRSPPLGSVSRCVQKARFFVYLS
jgi:hypothetical protein